MSFVPNKTTKITHVCRSLWTAARSRHRNRKTKSAYDFNINSTNRGTCARGSHAKKYTRNKSLIRRFMTPIGRRENKKRRDLRRWRLTTACGGRTVARFCDFHTRNGTTAALRPRRSGCKHCGVCFVGSLVVWKRLDTSNTHKDMTATLSFLSSPASTGGSPSKPILKPMACYLFDP